MARLAESLKAVLAHAEQAGIPWPSSRSRACSSIPSNVFARLDERVRHPLFDLTIDVGHVHCSAEGDIASLLRHWGPRIRISISKTWCQASTNT